jgi:hypothetical protein
MNYRRFTPFRFDIPADDMIPMSQVQTHDCPRCGYREVIQHEYVDYKKMYDAQVEYTEKMIKNFEKFLSDMGEEVVDAKIWMETKKEELENCIHQLIKQIKESI